MPSEFALIERHFKRPARHSVLGVGDDAAIVRPAPGMEIVVTTDMLVAGTHFLPDADPADLGWKTLAVNLSDLAAMGALPRWALLSLALPADKAADEAWLAAYAEGFFACADTFAVDLIGGDTTRGPLAFNVTLFGEIPAGQALLRSAARPADEIWISGTLGLATLGLAQRQARCRLMEPLRSACLRALDRPQPRIALGRALAQDGLAHAAIDVSDGLLADLGHILERSQATATLHFDRLPAAVLYCGNDVDARLATDCLLGGGDDYELAFTAPAARHEDILALGARLQIPLTCIGTVAAGPAGRIHLLDADGREMSPARRGYDHFAPATADTDTAEKKT
ncbi:thiamin-monophosphate kinase [Sterolibacterium denitrificans]|uniref:Thiamine-monophosphate kinase n=1 Tax=Sterolibacterium denitrificans TaxID=157592 RepID=A0A7Z7HPZ7_9PROT|nr:thiamine-phosphate kinase [Sterolibacterium denitrificans]SMB23820.1 thiamin-monophosphate kinase [Sterolibacterium denitrificans]